MGAFISKISNVVTQQIMKLTLYEMMRSSHNFEDVRSSLNDRTDWNIELFRSCFPIHLTNGNYFFTLSVLSFLIIAETIHIHFGRLSPAKLKERAESMGYAMLAILFVVPDIGFVVVRVAGLFALSKTPGLATSLTFVTMLPSVILPLLAIVAKFVKREHTSGGGGELESGIVNDETRT